mmetsp:Transcript_171411/g.416824  ORF Transcript_171411/g.416824 Transcript_171411/m.416824 type:complete len:802 (+) Transcript_171411:45-2450(+)
MRSQEPPLVASLLAVPGQPLEGRRPPPAAERAHGCEARDEAEAAAREGRAEPLHAADAEPARVLLEAPDAVLQQRLVHAFRDVEVLQKSHLLLRRGQLQMPHAQLLAGAAGGRAGAPLLPLAPHAVHWLVALPCAVARFLRSQRLARRAPAARLGPDVAEAPPLTPALVAGAPLAPVLPGAVLGLAVRRAGSAGTALHLRQHVLALHAPVRRRRQHLPLAHLRAAPTARAARAPGSPGLELAVHGGRPLAGLRRHLSWPRVARRGLLHRPHTELPLAPALHSDLAGAPLHAVAGAGAVAPGRPFSKDAVNRLLARHVFIAARINACGAGCGLAAVVGLHVHRPRAPRHAALAAAGAGRPLLPLAPGAVHAGLVRAGLLVAHADLLLAQRHAGLPPPLRGPLHAARARALAAPAGRGAVAPVGPVAPEAVHVLALGIAARVQLAELEAAAQASVPGLLQDRPLALALAEAAGGAAGAPAAPLAHLAVDPVAGLLIAAPSLHEARQAGLAPKVGVPDHLPVPQLLAALAGLVTRIPLAPLRELAVHSLAALLDLVERALADLASAERGVQLAAAPALAVVAAGAPLGPGAEGAVLRVRGAVAGVADRELLQAALARRAPVGRGHADRARALLEAAQAALRALRPGAPRAELARHGQARGGAELRLREPALARPAAVDRVLEDLPLPELLAVRRLAFTPGLPSGELAVLRLLALHWALLRLNQCPRACLTTAGACGPDHARALAELAARGLAPLRPLAHVAVQGLALPRAALELARGGVQLHAFARHAPKAREQVLCRLLLVDG